MVVETGDKEKEKKARAPIYKKKKKSMMHTQKTSGSRKLCGSSGVPSVHKDQ